MARGKTFGRPPPHAYTRVSLHCSLLSLARAVLRIVSARQGSSQYGRSPALAARGLVPSQTYKDLVECADDTAVFSGLSGALLLYARVLIGRNDGDDNSAVETVS